MKITDSVLKKIERRDKIYKVYDACGLSIEVPPKGSLRWRYKYKFADKEKRLSLGVYPATSIEGARFMRDEFKKLLSEGVDPAVRRKHNKIVASTDVNELTREQLIQRVLDLEGVVRQTTKIMLELKELMSKLE